MSHECSSALVLPYPYDQARRRILTTLKEQGLQVAFNFDVASGIVHSALVRLPKSSVLGVACPYQFLGAVVADGAAAVFFPVHVVLSEHLLETHVRILAPQVLRAASVTPAIAIPVHRTLRRILEALAALGAYTATRAQEGQLPPESEALDGTFQEEVSGA